MIDVISYYNEKILELKNRVAQFPSEPKLLIITDNQSSAGASYVKSKINACKQVGIFADTMVVNPQVAETEYGLYRYMEMFADSLRKVDGVIFQYPFVNLDWANYLVLVMAFVNDRQDVDGILPYSNHQPCTPKGIIHLIDHIKQKHDKQYDHIVIVGNGRMVGRPLHEIVRKSGHYSKIDLVDSKTTPEQFNQLLAKCDEHTVVVCATPVNNMITNTNINKACTYIDCGCNLVDGKLIGNVSRECYGDDMMITPVPNGVGKLTVLSLLENVVDSYEKKNGIGRN